MAYLYHAALSRLVNHLRKLSISIRAKALAVITFDFISVFRISLTYCHANQQHRNISQLLLSALVMNAVYYHHNKKKTTTSTTQTR
jgi:hypothetical protein